MYFLWSLVACLICGHINTGLCKSTIAQGDDYDYDDDYDPVKSDGLELAAPIENNKATLDPPYFVESEIILSTNTGGDLLINCDVRNFQLNNVVMWYKGNTLIVSGQYPLNHRAEALKNNSILIKNVQLEDAGNYYCEVLPEKIRLRTLINVGSHLVILCDGRDVTDKSLTFHEGETHTFECKTYGTGTKQIKWFLNGHRAENVDGSKVLIDSTDANHSGTYQCLGDDKSLDPPHGMVTINVQYSPKVFAHRNQVNTEKGTRAKLYCEYKADPIAVTRWIKNKEVLSYSEKHSVKNILHQGKNCTILTVEDVETSDLGEYECQFENAIGSSAAKIHLIYEPEIPQFEAIKIENKKVNLQWLVRSLQPLSEAVLDYKINGAYTWSTVSVIHTKRHHEHSGIWKLTHEMELVAGSWHARVKTKNTIGWSKFSLPHDFQIQENVGGDINTMGNEIPPQDMVMAAGIGFGKSKTSGSTNLIAMPAAVCASFMFFIQTFIRRTLGDL